MALLYAINVCENKYSSSDVINTIGIKGSQILKFGQNSVLQALFFPKIQFFKPIFFFLPKNQFFKPLVLVATRSLTPICGSSSRTPIKV